MKQERRFKLYANGLIKYFEDHELKGQMELTKDAKALKVSKFEINISLPKNRKDYTLI